MKRYLISVARLACSQQHAIMLFTILLVICISAEVFVHSSVHRSSYHLISLPGIQCEVRNRKYYINGVLKGELTDEQMKELDAYYDKTTSFISSQFDFGFPHHRSSSIAERRVISGGLAAEPRKPLSRSDSDIVLDVPDEDDHLSTTQPPSTFDSLTTTSPSKHRIDRFTTALPRTYDDFSTHRTRAHGRYTTQLTPRAPSRLTTSRPHAQSRFPKAPAFCYE
ncbi:hypothetical protein AB6A40_009187 [Gnathostoma spinigerum]|uniref:Pepsin inhibitor-3-like repeated domain-containing protein n=1 Tax=Gnathostoma spinigerum TaxID=75299 RepID=A0ABD6ER99_9BILA